MTMPPALEALLAGRAWHRVEAGEAGANVHRVERAGAPPLFVKHGTGQCARDVMDEAARLLWLAGRLPVPEVVQLIATPDETWLVSTTLTGRTGDELLDASGAHLPAIIDAAAALLRRLHALPIDECPFEAGRA